MIHDGFGVFSRSKFRDPMLDVDHLGVKLLKLTLGIKNSKVGCGVVARPACPLPSSYVASLVVVQ